MYRKLIGILLAGILVFAMTACSGGDDGDEGIAGPSAAEETEEPTETTATEAADKKLTVYQKAYKEQLDDLITQYGKGVTGGRLCDMDGDGSPEMIVIHDMKAEIYTIEGEDAVRIYEGKVGLKYGQTDAYYEVLLNRKTDPPVLVLFNASDEWVDENISAVTVSGGEAQVRSLKAATDGENDTPAREELKTFSINGKDVSAKEYDAEYHKLTSGADSINPMDAGLDGLQADLTK